MRLLLLVYLLKCFALLFHLLPPFFFKFILYSLLRFSLLRLPSSSFDFCWDAFSVCQKPNVFDWRGLSLADNGYVYETFGISKHFPVKLQVLLIRAKKLDNPLTAKCFIYDVSRSVLIFYAFQIYSSLSCRLFSVHRFGLYYCVLL